MNKKEQKDNSSHGMQSSDIQKAGSGSKSSFEKLPDKSLLWVIDLELELYKRNNVAIANLVVLSALMKGEKKQQKMIMERLKPDYLLGPKSIYSYLFRIISEEINQDGKVDISSIIERIPEHGPQVYGEPLDQRSLQGDYRNFARILYINPTAEQVEKAVDMVEGYAIKSGWAQ